MNADRCCEKRPRDSWMLRVREIAGLALPGTLLALMPKCPMCLAAYVAIGTGFTLSYSSAHLLMQVLTLLCISTLAFCLVRRIIRQLRTTTPPQLQITSTHP